MHPFFVRGCWFCAWAFVRRRRAAGLQAESRVESWAVRPIARLTSPQTPDMGHSVDRGLRHGVLNPESGQARDCPTGRRINAWRIFSAAAHFAASLQLPSARRDRQATTKHADVASPAETVRRSPFTARREQPTGWPKLPSSGCGDVNRARHDTETRLTDRPNPISPGQPQVVVLFVCCSRRLSVSSSSTTIRSRLFEQWSSSRYCAPCQ